MSNLYDHNYELVLNNHIDSLKHMRNQVYFNINYLQKDPDSERKKVLLPALNTAKGQLDSIIATYLTAQAYLRGDHSDVQKARVRVVQDRVRVVEDGLYDRVVKSG